MYINEVHINGNKRSVPNEVQLRLHQRFIVSLGNTFRFIFFFVAAQASYPGRGHASGASERRSEDFFPD